MWVHGTNTPPTPTPGSGGTRMRVPSISGKGVPSRDKVRPENCQKGGVFDIWLLTRRFLLKRGCVFFSLFLWTPEKFKKGVTKYLSLLYLKIIKYLIKSRAQIPEFPASFEQCSGFRGISKVGKACEKPAKGMFINVGLSGERGVFSKEENKRIHTLNNTEWGGGGAGINITRVPSLLHQLNAFQLSI